MFWPFLVSMRFPLCHLFWLTSIIRHCSAFYFNFQGSIYGEIRASRSSGSRIVPHNFFLATLLLPCGKLDGKVRKFTGSDDIGDAPDSMTKAVHAFAHWSLLYSQGHILFCDLQGTLNRTPNPSRRNWETSFNRCTWL
jgi:hypothetical protein